MEDRFKLRAWDAENKIMISHEELNEAGGFLYNGQLLCDKPEDRCTPYKGFILMQCTGLKDKNGKLIWEGDLVKYENGFTSSVSWGDFYNGKDEKMRGWITYDCPLSDYYTSFQLIGNIYENSEFKNLPVFIGNDEIITDND